MWLLPLSSLKKSKSFRISPISICDVENPIRLEIFWDFLFHDEHVALCDIKRAFRSNIFLPSFL